MSKFDGQRDDLHAIWDSFIPEKHAKQAGQSYASAAKAWPETLHQDPNHLAPMGECNGLEDAGGCALAWATDSNHYLYSDVFKDGVNSVTRTDLGGRYYEAAPPAVDELVLRAGLRLAAWISALYQERERMETGLFEQDGEMIN